MVDEMLRSWAAARGYRVAWCSKAAVEGVCKAIADRGANLELDERFFAHELTALLSEARDDSGHTVVVVATPRPAHLVSFEIDGGVFDALLPPTYFRYRAVFEDVRRDLAANGLPGAKVAQIAAPLKSIAALLGLVTYGRNNLCYAPGMGSYIQLCGYSTDAELPESGAAGKASGELLPDCTGCNACCSMCPTGAICEDRILLRAERCLTLASENPGEWPEWVGPRLHNCLLGCLECQRVCPANPELPAQHTGLCFSASETSLLLSGDGGCPGNAETGIRSKLAWLGLTAPEPVVGRNLRALRDAAAPVLK